MSHRLLQEFEFFIQEQNEIKRKHMQQMKVSINTRYFNVQSVGSESFSDSMLVRSVCKWTCTPFFQQSNKRSHLQRKPFCREGGLQEHRFHFCSLVQHIASPAPGSSQSACPRGKTDVRKHENGDETLKIKWYSLSFFFKCLLHFILLYFFISTKLPPLAYKLL